MKTLEGWIFDIYVDGRDMRIGVIDTNRRTFLLRDKFIPAFWVGGNTKDVRALARFIVDQPWDVRLSWVEYNVLHLEFPIPVLQVDVMNPHNFSTIFERVVRIRPKLEYYNGNIPIVQQYVQKRGLLLLKCCNFVVDSDDWILGIDVADAPRVADWETDKVISGNRKRT